MVGWPIMALCGSETQPPRWYEGLIVRHVDSEDMPYILYFESDDTWERVDLPDDTIVFRKGIANMVRQHVSLAMLPGNDADID